ncbi:LysR family transcriptional regulator [Paraburkholderia fynbosensis]|uniref:HTH-type transcriptional regulator PgrR n=1 Tax=Paraburkholderia fynbosensis TaxID=1200993 RepID=A0A6J5H1P8_9BURK|nr:LysR family transcriptional regulator [Paraburkholderia fynbosensis]CAB3810861.1 HTH-type transcriptional regulator PgrR [Paraburkholderia fynbosensis]
MDRFQSMQVFAKVVELNSFSKAADALRLPRSTVSIIVGKLEAYLRIRLMQRTTRRLSLTPEGAQYYRDCIRILAGIDEAEDLFSSAPNRPRGRLHVQMPTTLGRLVVVPRLDDFHKQFPDIELVIELDDGQPHPTHESVECSIRFEEPDEGNGVSRRLGDVPRITACSPDYLRRYGEPQRVEDLQQHRSVQCFSRRSKKVTNFMFDIDGDSVEVGMSAMLAISDEEACGMCSARDAGLVQAPGFVLAQYMESGQLVEVLSKWRPRPIPVIAVYPHNRHVSLRARVFVEWLAGLFEDCPLLSSELNSKDQPSTGNRVNPGVTSERLMACG